MKKGKCWRRASCCRNEFNHVAEHINCVCPICKKICIYAPIHCNEMHETIVGGGCCPDCDKMFYFDANTMAGCDICGHVDYADELYDYEDEMICEYCYDIRKE